MRVSNSHECITTAVRAERASRVNELGDGGGGDARKLAVVWRVVGCDVVFRVLKLSV